MYPGAGSDQDAGFQWGAGRNMRRESDANQDAGSVPRSVADSDQDPVSRRELQDPVEVRNSNVERAARGRPFLILLMSHLMDLSPAAGAHSVMTALSVRSPATARGSARTVR